MIRLACVLALLALAVLGLLLVRLDGATAIVFSFVGMPALGLALALYAFARWRAGAFRLDAPREDQS
jgi:hypothetical protein